MKTALLVVNPTAGAGRAPERAAELERELEANGVAAQIIPTTPAPERSLTEKLINADVAVAVGGGTLNRVAGAILRIDDPVKRPTLGFLACGTGNAAVRAFRLPRRASDLAALIRTGSTRAIDVGVVWRDGAQVAVFLLWAGAGVDASLIESIAERRSAYRGWRLTAQYIRQASRMLLAYRFPEMHLACGAVTGTFGGVVVANVGQLAIGSVTAHADPSDGLLNVVATQPRNRAAWIGAAMLSAIHLYDHCPRVNRTLATALRVDSGERVPVHADGEPIGALPGGNERGLQTVAFDPGTRTHEL